MVRGCAAGSIWHTDAVASPKPRKRQLKPQSDRLVVVGASAGGIEALSVVVSGLPADFGAPIVLAQHLHPDHPSSLVEIISRRTALRVLPIADHMPLEPGTIYIVPPDRHVSISDHSIRLEDSDASRPKPSVDRLFETASEVFGDRLVAVILSGTGSDGAAGAQYVSAAGGSVIAQDPETASFPAMPRSLSPHTVDAVTDLAAIGPLLQDLISGATTIKGDDETLDRFLGQLRDRSGIDFGAYKRPTIVRRLERRMAATRSKSLAEYRRYLLRQPDEVHRLTSSLLIKVTEFFRDRELYDHLRSVVLPTLIEAAEPTRELRLWSAGCATGEEAYSLAILVAEALGDELPTWNVRIFATDADAEAIAFARRGVYPASAIEAIDPALRSAHLRQMHGEFEIAPHIRAMTVFGEHDLGQRAPFPRIDLILCRNVLIYFTAELQRRALQLFAFSLRDGGYLVLGKSELTNPLPTSFTVEEPTLRVSRRAGDRVLFPSGRGRHVATVGSQPIGLAPIRRPPSLVSADRGQSSPPVLPTERADSFLQRLPLGVCVVDASYDLRYVNAAARSLLGIHGAAIGQDFIHHARSLDSARLRELLDHALAGQPETVVLEVASETPIGAARTLELTATSLPAERGGDGPGVLVSIHDVTGTHDAAIASAGELARRAEELGRISTNAERLTDTNRELLRGNAELAEVNAEIRTANEELLVYNEELQAASEEVETLNEELQATNEELETLNEELQATIEELNTANDDLAARAAADEDAALAPRSAPLRLVDAAPDQPPQS